MRKPLSTCLAAASLAFLTGTAAYSQSAYFQAMTNLNPIVYLPLQETTPPPIGDVETNLGSLGPVANAVYSSTSINKSQGGATADGDTSVLDTDAAGGFLAVPTTDSRTAVTNATFTVECWVNSAEQGRNFEGILSKAGGNSGGIGGANNLGGWCLSQNYIAYLDTANFRGWDFHVYNGIGHEGAEILVPYNVTNNVWYHLVATFDGSNCKMYVNGVDMVATGDAVQIPMTGSYVPDTWQPLEIGSSRNLNGNNYHGNIDEVAVYSGVLSPSSVAAHYAAASSASPYSTTILADNPLMYWRMDAPNYTAPDPSTYPIATNYGTLASSFFGLYGTAVQPGISGPQFSGMLDSHNGNSSYGVAVNGIGGNNGGTANVPVGYAAGIGSLETAPDAAPIIITNDYNDPNALLLNPTNYTGSTVSRTPFSCSIWFQGRPHDWNRFQTIFGHTDDGWRLAMNGSGRVQWNPGPGGEVQTTYIYDDGKWHQFFGTYDGTNVLTYVDGRLDASTTSTGNGNGSATFPMIGGDPQYLSAGNANYNVGDIGRAGAATGYANRLFSGNVAHFAFFTNVLTAAQIANLYTIAAPNQTPYILSQPTTGRVNPPEGFIFFGVVANGAQPLSYQWYYNSSSNYAGATPLVNDGVKYASATTSQVTVSNLVNSDSGYYFVVITNNAGSVTSILASLSVNYGPKITSQVPSANFNLYPNQEATLAVTAIAETNAPLTYQWYVNGVGDPSGTNAVYMSPGVTTAGTSFYCIVTNLYGSATSAPVVATAILPMPTALTNAPYSSNLLALGPTAYWPMHDVGTPAQGDTETNYGSLGTLANAGYADWRADMASVVGQNFGNGENATNNVYVIHGIKGAITGDANPAIHFAGGNGGQNVDFMVTPHASPKVTLVPPFTLEAWVRPDNNPSFMVILSEDSGDTLNGNGNRGGFNWLYSGGTPNCFSMTVYNGNGGGSTEPKTTANYPPGAWYHLVTTFDGTNVVYYINGVQDPLINSSAATMNPNTWDPITIGCGRGYGNNLWQGSIDEVAVYTNLLPVNVITNHYYVGTNGSGAYKSTVLAANPVLYYRMDSPTWAPPAINTWPTLTNYGTVAINGVYTPGAVPSGGAGPSQNGKPIIGLPANTALVTDGNQAFADALNVPAFHPSGKTPFTVAAWMKANPADIGARNWQSIVAGGDSSWRLNLDGGNGRANFNNNGGSGDIGNSTTSGANVTINDGQWHYVVGTSDGSNTIVYVDGLASATNFNANVNESSQNVEVFLGAYPNNTVYADTWHSVFNEVNAFGNDNGRILAGSICEAAFWNGKALTPVQIGTLYNSLQIAPIIDTQPVSASVNQNSAFTNFVVASGSGPLAYQWYQNGSPRSGQTNASLTLANVQVTDASPNWYLVVTNNYGATTSAVVSLTVFSVPTITKDISGTNLILYAGGHAAWSITAVGAVPLRYQWYSNNVAIAGATSASYALFNAQPPGVTNTYYCIVTNSAGSATSSTAFVSILSVPNVIPYSLVVMGDNPTGFWPLDETNNNPLTGNANGVIANDYAGGWDGIYTNVMIGQQGFNPTLDPNRTAVQFGSYTFQDSDVYNIPTNVDFSATNGASSNFSIECWAKGFPQTVDAGVITKGYGGGGEQFNLDCGSDGVTPSHAYRFFVRDASGTVHAIVSSVNPGDGVWHHLAAVCNETNGWLILYVDGEAVGSNAIAPGSGILSSTRSMTIGARPSNSTTNDNDLQYVGYIQDVAAYNYALSPQQVANHFNAGDIPASVFTQPTNVTVGEFGTAVFTSFAIGTPPLGYQWFDANTGLPIPGATNATFVTNNVPFSANGDQYYLLVTNNFGTNYSGVPPQTPVSLTVIQGLAQIVAQPPGQMFVESGQSFSISVTAYGTMPLSYQWQMSDTNEVNWTNLTDSARITGSLSNVVSFASAKKTDAGTYQLVINNSYGSVTSSIATVIVGSLPVNFNGNGAGWTTNQSGGPYSGNPPFISTNVLTLTDGNGNEDRSFFFQYPQYIGAFKAAFTYQVPSGGPPTVNEADGMTFCLQNDPRGVAALGGGGGSLGYSGITPSWCFQFNLYPNYNNASSPNSGWCFATNGVIPFNGTTTYPPTGTLDVGSGDPIGVILTYLNGVASLVLTDAVAQTSFSTNLVVNLPAVLGASTAYVGFTGADGGAAAVQVITNFSFVSITAESIRLTPTNTVAISWPGAISGYVVQQTHNLSSPNWVDVTNADAVLSGNHLVVIPVTNTNTFYRLSLEP